MSACESPAAAALREFHCVVSSPSPASRLKSLGGFCFQTEMLQDYALCQYFVLQDVGFTQSKTSTRSNGSYPHAVRS